MKLTDTQKAALDKSIEHYKRAKFNRRIYLSPRDCACCQEWWTHKEDLNGKRRVNCDGCPIKAHTGLDCCFGTPFYPLNDEAKTDLAEIRDNDEQYTDEEYFAMVQDELDFLIDLREEKL